MGFHRGQIVKSIVRQSGYSLVTLAKRLSISRSTLYNRLRAKNLSYEFIINIGYIIGFEFYTVFPALKSKKNDHNHPFSSAKDEYIMLLERYNDLLALATKSLVSTDALHIRHKVSKFIQNKIAGEI